MITPLARRSRLIRYWPDDHPDESKAGKPMEVDRTCACGKAFVQTAIDPTRLAEMPDGKRDAFLKTCRTYRDGTICHPNRCPECERRDLSKRRSA